MADKLVLPILDRSDKILDRTLSALGDASRTVKFLRGRARFASRESDVFIASYPRSGTTWTQLITYLLASGEPDIGFGHLAEVSRWWERSLAYDTRGAENLAAMPGRRVFKTHLPRRWLPDGPRYIYVWRNPADVAVSYYHLYQRYLRFDGAFSEFFDRFMRGDVQYGSWFRHVAGWRRHENDPRVLLVPYEEMHAQPALWVRRIAGFIGVDVDDHRVAEITGHTDFASMKAAHEKFDYVGELRMQWGIREGEFIREGKTGGGAGVLSEEQLASLERKQASPVPYPSIEWRLPAFLH